MRNGLSLLQSDKEILISICRRGGNMKSNNCRSIKGKRFNNIEYIDVSGEIIWFKSKKAIMGYEKGKTFANLIWGADSEGDFLELLRKVDFEGAVIKIEFVPEEFEFSLKGEGFRISGEFVDGWLYDLQNSDLIINGVGDIRVIKKSELEVASAITKSCRKISRGFEGESVENLEEWFSNINNTGLFILQGNIPVGFLMVGLYGFEREDGPVCWIRELAIKPEFQGQGYGRELLNAGLAWGRTKGAKKSFLAVDKLNVPAMKLYKSVGYEINSDRGQVNMERAT